MATNGSCRQRGFTLVELAVVVVIIGILAAFAVPRFLTSVERSKAEEAFNYLAAIQAAQDRYHDRQGIYAQDVDDLEVERSVLEHFETTGVMASDPITLQTMWSQTLTRKGASAAYGAYTVTFNEEGFDGANSTITNLPDINPMQTNGRK